MSTPPFPCHDCKKFPAFQTQLQLTEHKASDHFTVLCYRCKICDLIFVNREKAKNHVMKLHMGVKDVKNEAKPTVEVEKGVAAIIIEETADKGTKEVNAAKTASEVKEINAAKPTDKSTDEKTWSAILVGSAARSMSLQLEKEAKLTAKLAKMVKEWEFYAMSTEAQYFKDMENGYRFSEAPLKQSFIEDRMAKLNANHAEKLKDLQYYEEGVSNFRLCGTRDHKYNKKKNGDIEKEQEEDFYVRAVDEFKAMEAAAAEEAQVVTQAPQPKCLAKVEKNFSTIFGAGSTDPDELIKKANELKDEVKNIAAQAAKEEVDTLQHKSVPPGYYCCDGSVKAVAEMPCSLHDMRQSRRDADEAAILLYEQRPSIADIRMAALEKRKQEEKDETTVNTLQHKDDPTGGFHPTLIIAENRMARYNAGILEEKRTQEAKEGTALNTVQHKNAPPPASIESGTTEKTCSVQKALEDMNQRKHDDYEAAILIHEQMPTLNGSKNIN